MLYSSNIKAWTTNATSADWQIGIGETMAKHEIMVHPKGGLQTPPPEIFESDMKKLNFFSFFLEGFNLFFFYYTTD